MSDYFARAKHPEYGTTEFVHMMDNYFGHHVYGVRFGTGKIFHIDEVDILPELGAEKRFNNPKKDKHPDKSLEKRVAELEERLNNLSKSVHPAILDSMRIG